MDDFDILVFSMDEGRKKKGVRMRRGGGIDPSVTQIWFIFHVTSLRDDASDQIFMRSCCPVKIALIRRLIRPSASEDHVNYSKRSHQLFPL